MEIEQITPQIVGKKLWNIVRIVFYMVRKGVSSKSKLIQLHLQLGLQLMLKRGKLAAGKALSNLMLHHHYSALTTCRSHHSVRVFTGHAPHEYEFSCSNSPAANKRRNHRRENKIDADVFQRVFEMLNDRPEAAAVDGSPLTPLPGFGRTPTVRQLRVTDSPFPLKDSEEINSQVDMDAEEFIRKFYRQLNQQSKKAALGSPSPYHIRAR